MEGERTHRNGFTLLETIIFAAIFGVVVGAIYLMYSTSHTTFTRGQTKIEVQQNARVAMEMVARETRTAGYDPSDALTTLGTTAIQTANANSITFIADVDGDNSNPADGTPDTDQVTFRLNGTQLIRDFSTWGGAAFPAPTASVLADGVSALTFTYLDGSDVVTATLADIRRITITITTQETAGGRTETYPLTMDVRLRNL